MELRPGFTFLLGKNGSGKSTLIKIMTSSLCARADITLYGQALSPDLLRRRMSYLPQEFELYPELTLNEMLEFLALAKGLSRAEAQRQIQAVSQQMDISKFLHRKGKACSPGIRRRAGIASALLGDSSVVILDEPTAGIDPGERARLYQIFRTAMKGKIVLIATHILEDMETLADRVIMLENGAISFDDSYEAFSHILDGRLFWVDDQGELSAEEREFVAQTRRLPGSDRRSAGYKVISDRPLLPGSIHIRQVAPELEDIWNAYGGQ